VILGMVITGIGMLVPFAMYTYPMIVVGFILLGIGNTIMQVSANPLLLDISTEDAKAANLSLSQFVKAIASMLGPIIVAGLATYTGNWKLVFPVYAALSFLSSIWLYSVKIEESKPEKEPATLKTVFTLLKNKFILIMVIAIFFMVGFDVAMNSNIATFLSGRFDISLESASIGISIYFFSLMTGRFIGAILLRKADPKKFLVISTVITLIGLVGIVVSPDLNVTRVLIFIAGLGFSNLFPVMFAIIVQQKPDYANELSGLIILAVSGGALIPPIMGVLSDNFGVTSSIYVLIFCVLYISYAAYYAIKK
jgi:fucose permease